MNNFEYIFNKLKDVSYDKCEMNNIKNIDDFLYYMCCPYFSEFQISYGNCQDLRDFDVYCNMLAEKTNFGKEWEEAIEEDICYKCKMKWLSEERV